MKIAVIGSGSWGKTLANLLIENNPDQNIVLWARRKEVADSINHATNNLREAIKSANILVIAIPSQFLREQAKEINKHIKDNAVVVSATKGLETETFKRMSEVLKEEIRSPIKLAVLSGPNLSKEIIEKKPATTVIASSHKEVLKQLKKLFSNNYFRVYTSHDVAGVEICGYFKNIIAIAVGIADGLALGDNYTGHIISRGLREMLNLGKHFGVKQETIYGPAGIGDLVTTSISKHSRNRTVGTLIAKGFNYEDIKKEMGKNIPEGIATTKAVHDYALKRGLTTPITDSIYNVLFTEDK
ncbi:NAD(P)-dependent glycerol-3-phosphate dehydrogenase [Patescibacteria group bacterium]|nr:NAD(P)-dependent glycerol-3-phosphate dehydrogenase [Patescibacteria group bacterium]MBU2633455.1 NAD(P)-dependent glycerol-3-phosphate dehydrogenase [Patescibacteria group bacterium]